MIILTYNFWFIINQSLYLFLYVFRKRLYSLLNIMSLVDDKNDSLQERKYRKKGKIANRFLRSTLI